jgi:hypothetical protein
MRQFYQLIGRIARFSSSMQMKTTAPDSRQRRCLARVGSADILHPSTCNLQKSFGFLLQTLQRQAFDADIGANDERAVWSG